MNLNISSKKIGIKISLFSILILFWSFSMLSGYGTSTNLIAAVISVVFILFSDRIISNKCEIAFAFFYIFYVVTSMINTYSLYYLLGTCIAYTLVIYSPLFVNSYLAKSKTHDLKDCAFRIFTIIWFLIVILSITTFITNPEGGRAYVNDHRGTILGGGYSAAYGSAILGVVFFIYFLSTKRNKKIRRLLFLGFVISAIHVISTMSAITLVAFAVGIALSFFFHDDKRKKVIKSIC